MTEKEELALLRSMTRCKFFLLSKHYWTTGKLYAPCILIRDHKESCEEALDSQNPER